MGNIDAERFTADTRNPIRDLKVYLVQLVNKPVDTLDDEVYSRLKNAYDGIPDTPENLFDTFPRLFPVQRKHAGQEFNKAAENLFHAIDYVIDVSFRQLYQLMEPTVCAFVQPIKQTCQTHFEQVKNAQDKCLYAGEHLNDRLFHFLQVKRKDAGNKPQRTLHNVLNAGQHISYRSTRKTALFYDGVYDCSKDIPHKVQQIGQQNTGVVYKVDDVVQRRAPIPGEYVADKPSDILKQVYNVLPYLLELVRDFIKKCKICRRAKIR